MSFVETETNGQIFTIRLNRPERLNALSTVIREGMAEAFTKFHNDNNLEVAILTGTGRGFCAGEDMKESLDRGIAGSPKEMVKKDLTNPFQDGILQKPVISSNQALIWHMLKPLNITKQGPGLLFRNN